MNATRRIAVFTGTLLASACAREFAPSEPRRVFVIPYSSFWPDTVAVADVDTIAAAVVDSASRGELADLTVEWSSSDPTVLAVSPIASTPGGTVARAAIRAQRSGFAEVNARVVRDGLVTASRSARVVVTMRWTSVSVGAQTCAIGVDQNVYCWGSRQKNGIRLFAGYIPAALPTPAPGLPPGPFHSVSARGVHTCATAVVGFVYCWGGNRFGELGTGNQTYLFSPERVVGGLLAGEAISGESRTCALLKVDYPTAPKNSAVCWGLTTQITDGLLLGSFIKLGGGFGTFGEEDCGLGLPAMCRLAPAIDASILTRSPPSFDLESVQFKNLSLGSDHACGVDIEGRVMCWGRDDLGQLGTTAPDICQYEPDYDPGSGGVEFGMPTYGNSGTAQRESACSEYPVEVRIGASPFEQVSVGERVGFTCAVNAARELYCWGAGYAGQVGPSAADICEWEASPNSGRVSFGCALRPVRVGPEHEFASVSAGRDFACALTVAGAAYCWGNNSEAALGTVTEEPCGSELPGALLSCSSRPVPVSGDLLFTSLAAGGDTVCAIERSHGGIYCWGLDPSGSGDPRFSLTPIRIGEPNFQ